MAQQEKYETGYEIFVFFGVHETNSTKTYLNPDIKKRFSEIICCIALYIVCHSIEIIHSSTINLIKKKSLIMYCLKQSKLGRLTQTY